MSHLGKGAIIVVGNAQFTGHQEQGVFLQEYDAGTDSYTGVIFPHNEFFTQFLVSQGKGAFAPGEVVNSGVALRVPGLRQYPYAARPQYAFQFVLAGEDPAPLHKIMADNFAAHQAARPVEATVEEGGDNPPA